MAEWRYKGKTAEEIMDEWDKNYEVEKNISQVLRQPYLDGIKFITTCGNRSLGVKSILEPETPEELKGDLLNLAERLYILSVDCLRGKESLELGAMKIN